MNMLRPRWLKLGLALIVPLLLCAMLAKRASWRPRTLHYPDEVVAVAYSPNGRWLADASLSKLEVRDAHTEQIIWSENLAYSRYIPERQIAFSPDSKILAVSLANSLKLWSVATHKLRHDLLHHHWQYGAGTLRFTSDNTRLVTGSYTASHMSLTVPLLLWDIRTGQPLHIHKPTTKFPIDLLTLSSDGRTLALRMLDAKKVSYVSLRTLDTGQEQCALYPLGGVDAYCAAFAPNRKTLAVGTVNGKIMLWDIATRRWISQREANPSAIYGLAFSPDGRYLASNDMYTVELWDVRQGTYLRTLTADRGFINGLAFSPDSSTLAVACEQKVIQLWRIK